MQILQLTILFCEGSSILLKLSPSSDLFFPITSCAFLVSEFSLCELILLLGLCHLSGRAGGHRTGGFFLEGFCLFLCSFPNGASALRVTGDVFRAGGSGGSGRM